MARKTNQPRQPHAQQEYDESFAIHEAIQRGDASPLSRVFREPGRDIRLLKRRVQARIRRRVQARLKKRNAAMRKLTVAGGDILVPVGGVASAKSWNKVIGRWSQYSKTPGLVNIDVFNEMIETWGAGAEQLATAQYRQYATAILMYCLEATPVRTHRARNGWMVGVNVFPTGLRRSVYIDGILQDQASLATTYTRESLERINQATIWDNIHIVNNVPYFPRLDDMYRITAKAVGFANTVTAPNVPTSDIPLSKNSTLFKVPVRPVNIPEPGDGASLGEWMDYDLAVQRGRSRPRLGGFGFDHPRAPGQKSYSTFLGTGGEFAFRPRAGSLDAPFKGRLRSGVDKAMEREADAISRLKGMTPRNPRTPPSRTKLTMQQKTSQMRNLTELRYQMRLFEENVKNQGGTPLASRSMMSRRNRKSSGGGKPFYGYGEGGF